jgi:hypothetical protein
MNVVILQSDLVLWLLVGRKSKPLGRQKQTNWGAMGEKETEKVKCLLTELDSALKESLQDSKYHSRPLRNSLFRFLTFPPWQSKILALF